MAGVRLDTIILFSKMRLLQSDSKSLLEQSHFSGSLEDIVIRWVSARAPNRSGNRLVP